VRYALRQILSILALPFVVTIVVPLWTLRRRGGVPSLSADPRDVAIELLGAAVLALGLWLFGYSLLHFWRRGRGTLAPWDPPRQLVVSGPYRFVRNPMISGVLFILCGEALLLRSTALGGWTLLFLLMNVVVIPLTEEPMLEARFGEPYREYKRHVGRLIPRLRPWHAEQGDEPG
jgi:protein-S-isoprenylcysteine O-methyltransferase Ste14